MAVWTTSGLKLSWNLRTFVSASSAPASSSLTGGEGMGGDLPPFLAARGSTKPSFSDSTCFESCELKGCAGWTGLAGWEDQASLATSAPPNVDDIAGTRRLDGDCEGYCLDRTWKFCDRFAYDRTSGTLPVRDFCSGGTVPVRDFCSGGTVPVRDFCSGGTVPVRNFCSGGTVPPAARVWYRSKLCPGHSPVPISPYGNTWHPTQLQQKALF